MLAGDPTTPAPGDHTRQLLKHLALLLCIVMLFVGYAWYGLGWVNAEIASARLPAQCELFFYGGTSQPEFTVAVGCPGRDLIRLWPLPVINPWFEDGWERPTPGLQAGHELLEI